LGSDPKKSKMLENGHPPDDWNALVAEARRHGKRLALALTGTPLEFE